MDSTNSDYSYVSNQTLLIGFLIYFAIASFLYATHDINYFIHFIFSLTLSQIKRKVGVFETTTTYGVSLTQDIDAFIWHMNNARYLRELDFARGDFYHRSGLYNAVVCNKGTVYQGASNIRYRKKIPLYTMYRITTKLVYWSEKHLYIENRFITRDKIVRAVCYSRQDVVGVDVDHMMKVLLRESYNKPQCPEEIQLWIDSMEVSSKKLKTETNGDLVL